MNEETTREDVSFRTERWLIRGAAILALGLLGWMGTSIQGLQVTVAGLVRELEITKPTEILRGIQEVKTKVNAGILPVAETRITQLEFEIRILKDRIKTLEKEEHGR